MVDLQDADVILWDALRHRGIENLSDLPSGELVSLALEFAIWLPTSTYLDSPWLAPFAVRRLRVRTDENAPGPARDLWGFPDSSGYFADDNSLIKATVRGRNTLGSVGHYSGGRLRTGLVCCHIWPKTTADPLLFSFIPNLVWLPRSLAVYSDSHFATREPHMLHHVLRELSANRYKPLATNRGRARVDRAWGRLEIAELVSGTWPMQATEIADGWRLTQTAVKRTKRMTAFLGKIVDGGVPTRRFSRRYHAGLGANIDLSVPAVQEFISREKLELLHEDILSSLEES